jgi:hypothetical protein
MAKTIGVDPVRMSGLQLDYSAKAHSAVKNNDEHFFTAFEAFLKADYQQKSELIEKVLGRKFGEEKSFIVGEVFQHRNSKLVPQWFGDDFKAKMWEPAKERRVSINAFGNNILKEYILTKTMNDTSIQSATNSTPMEEDQFWAMLYLLIIDPKLGKKILKYELRKDKVCVFHVRLASGGVIAVSLVWFDVEWYLYADVFDSDYWYRDNVFLFPATQAVAVN